MAALQNNKSFSTTKSNAAFLKSKSKMDKTEKVPLSKVYSDMTLSELYEHQGMLMGLWEINMDNQKQFEQCLDQITIQIKMKLKSYFDGIEFEK